MHMNSNFVHLHFHSSYSLLDGYNPIPKAVARIKELGMKACALTDHNHLGGIIEWQEECQKQGIKNINGIETYFTWDINECAKDIEDRQKDAVKKAMATGAMPEDYFSKKHKKSEYKALIEPFMYDNKQYHLILLAMNQTGWHNLIKIQSEAARRCTFNGRFLCDDELLKKYNKGIICQSACIASAPARLVLRNKLKEAKEQILKWKKIFGDRFYLEIQPLNIYQQHAVNQFYMDMCRQYNIQPVATNDVHWTLKEDYDDHDTLLCIGTGAKKTDKERMRYSNDFWIKSEEEMYQSFKAQTESMAKTFKWDDEDTETYTQFYTTAMDNTQIIADRIDDNIQLGSNKPLFPDYKTKPWFTADEELTFLAWTGLYKYLAEHPECDRHVYEKRLNDELDVIIPKGFAPYFLTVYEYANWANSHNCPTGPGRGSAAGSLVSFVIGITHTIDPIKYKLWFSRFLTKDRNSPPD